MAGGVREPPPHSARDWKSRGSRRTTADLAPNHRMRTGRANVRNLLYSRPFTGLATHQLGEYGDELVQVQPCATKQ